MSMKGAVHRQYRRKKPPISTSTPMQAQARASGRRSACACIGVLVLIGGFFLRYCLCMAPFMDIASYL